MKPKIYTLILLIVTIANYGQNLIPYGEIGRFSSARSFSINPYGIIFVADDLKNEIIKLDTLGNVLKSIGGYGWDINSFENPIDVFANVLNVYVADKNNNRIQIFDKDLNFLSQISTNNTNDERFAFKYPSSVVTSTQGDFYILDGDNQRILRFNLRGEFISEIGGVEAGEYRLTNPIKLSLDNNFNLLTAESNTLFVFDQFGNGKRKITLPFAAKNLNALYNNFVIVNEKQILIANTSTDSNLVLNTVNPKLVEDIVDACVFKSKLYVLTNSTIFIYQLKY